MLVKVLGSIGDRQVNEIFNLSENARGAELRSAVSDRLEHSDVELFCMGHSLSNEDIVPAGCVIHMRVVDSNRPPAFEAPKQDAEAPKPPAPEGARNPDQAAEILYDEEAGPDQVLGQNWNDPEVIARYRQRLQERGVDPEVAQRQLDETLQVVKKYQHFVLFFCVLTFMELLAWPALTHRIPDPGQGTVLFVDTSSMSAWEKFFLHDCDYIDMLNILWWITVIIGLICMIGALAGDQGSGSCMTWHRATQYIYIAVNIYFLIGSAFDLHPFKGFIQKGSWVSMACACVLGSLFRMARLYVSYRYMSVYNSLKKAEREYAHKTMLCSIEQPQPEQPQEAQAGNQPEPGPNPGLQMV